MPLLDDSPTWIAVGLAIGAAVLALLAALLAGLVARRRGSPLGPRQTEAPEPSGHLQSMLADLAEALERAREEGRRSRRLGDIRETLDLDGVVARTLEAAAAIAGVDAAMAILTESGDGERRPTVASIGLSDEEAAAQPIGGSPGRLVRAVSLVYHDREDDEPGVVRGGLAVPLTAESGEQAGTLAVFWRDEARAPSEEQIESLEELARAAGPAIENARRFREARQLADLDSLTSLHNRRYFHETLARECARARRYDRRLALLVLDLDGFKTVNDRVGHLAGDTLLAAVGQRIRAVVRSADIACRVGGDEFAVILPEATAAEAEELYRRLQLALASEKAGASEHLRVSAGIAELRPEEDSLAFFKRADEALYRVKETGKGQALPAEGRS